MYNVTHTPNKANRGGLLILAAFLFIGNFVLAATWINYGSDLLAGTFGNTLYNSSGKYIQLNWTDATNTTYVYNGTYVSAVRDFVSSAKFMNISWNGYSGTCSYGNMSYIDKLGGYCIDKYEASVPGCDVVGGNCAMTGWAGYCAGSCVPNSGAFGDTAGTGTTVNATSRSGVPPLVSISRDQAVKMCSNAGKYLCSSKEWLGAANVKGQIYDLPTGASGAYIPNNDASTTTNCNTNYFCTENPTNASNNVCLTGSRTDCRSSESVYDMVGNVWEWTNETVTSISPDGAAGWKYINTTSGGWSTSSAADNGKYGKDGTYFPAGTIAGQAVVRGGRWLLGAGAGPFCANLGRVPSSVYDDIGFRCCSAPN